MNLKRSLALALAFLLVLTAVPAFGAGETLERIAGANRWETAVEISKEGWNTAEVVVLANGRNYPDALAGVPLAHALGGPVLLTEPDSLVPAAKAEIQRLGASKVVLLGGVGVLAQAVEDELLALGLTVDRISGADRYATAAAIAAKVAPGGAGTVVLVSGQGFADALAAASYAAIHGYPVLLTKKDELPAASKKAIEDLGATHVVVVGGVGVIADSTVADLPGVVRISGANREATSVALAEYFALPTAMYYLASGDSFADAIAGAVLAAKNGTGILLVRGSFPGVVGDFLKKGVTSAVIFGGTGVVKESVAQAAAQNLVQSQSGITGFVGQYPEDGEEGGGPSKGAVVAIAGKEVKTDEDGFYELLGVAPGKHNVTISKPGYEVVTRNDVVIVEGKLVFLGADLLTPLDSENVVITGIVYDADTFAPVEAHVLVNAWSKDLGKWVKLDTTTSDASGQFQVTGVLNHNTEYQVTVSRDVAGNPDDAYKAQTRTIKTDAFKNVNPFTQPFAMQAVKPVSISGTILDKGGTKLDGTEIYLHLGDTLLATTVADTGEYEFTDLTLPSGTYTISTEEVAENALYTAGVTIVEGVDKTHNIKLVAGYGFTLTLATDLGETLLGELTAQVYQGSTKVGVPVTDFLDSEADSLVFDMVSLYPTGNYVVEVSGWFIVTTKIPVSITKAGQAFVGRAQLAGIVWGSIEDEWEDGIENAVVSLVNSAGKEVASTKTDADGEYELLGVPGGSKYKVTATHPNYVAKTSAAFDLAVKDDVDINLVLAAVPTTGTFKGVVRDAESMEFIDAAIWVRDEDGEWIYDTHSSAGQYELELDPGTYLLEVSNRGHHETHYETVTVVAASKPVTKHFFLTAGSDATLVIKSVKNAKGEDIDFDDLDFDLEDDYDCWWTSDDGIFDELPANTYTLYIETPDGYLDYEQTVTIAKGATKELNIVLTSCNEVTFQVFGWDFPGYPVEDALVVVYDASGKLVAGAWSSDDGAGIVNLVNGTYTFKFYAEFHFVGTLQFTVDADHTTLPPIYLELDTFNWPAFD